MITPSVSQITQPDGTSKLRIEDRPNGPLIVIGNDGSISLNRQPDEAAKLFWEAVTIAGSTYVEKIQGLQQVIEQLQLANKALSVDPFREIVHGSSEAVYQAMSAADRKVISRYNVQTVLDTVNQLAMQAIQ